MDKLFRVLIGNTEHPVLLPLAAAVAIYWIGIDTIQFGFFVYDRISATPVVCVK